MAILRCRGRRSGGGSSRYGLKRWIFNATIGLALAFSLPAAAKELRLLAFGDSLTAGYGLPVEDGFVAQLERAINAAGVDAVVLDAGVSGDTTAGGRSRIAWALGDKPTHALIALGANDALRGLPPEAAKANLAAILEATAAAGVPVLLAGMRAPRNWGDDYVEQFDAIYPALAAEMSAPLYPFFLEGVALDPALNQADGIHPNAAGVEAIVAGLLPSVLHLLQQEPRP